jgi:hypothetical protein
MRNDEPQSVDQTLADSLLHALGVHFLDQGLEALSAILMDRKENA